MRKTSMEAPIFRTFVASLTVIALTTSPILSGERPNLASTGKSPADNAGPDHDVVLTVTLGAGLADGRKTFQIDLPTLQAMDSTFLQTSTPWTDGVPVFRGVLARDLLRSLDAVAPAPDGNWAGNGPENGSGSGLTVRAIALNDYRYDIPLADFMNYPVLLAYEMNGEALEVRGKGPIWIVYPLDHYGELRTRLTERKMVWQLVELQVR